MVIDLELLCDLLRGLGVVAFRGDVIEPIVVELSREGKPLGICSQHKEEECEVSRNYNSK